MFYSKSAKGFYLPEIHGDKTPTDAVEISDELYKSLIDGQCEGKTIDADENGMPILVDPPAPTPEEIQKAKNAEARAYLSSTDWYVVRFSETGESIPKDVSEKRAAARKMVVEV